MIHFSRLGTLSVLAGGVLLLPLLYAEVEFRPVSSNALLLSHSTQGYLGVGLNDVDNDRATVLKLKDAHGAEIITVDQDAPAGKAGLKVHDVVIQMNGQRIEGVEQFRRMLRETPPGRTVTLAAVRDGQTINLTVKLADHAAIATIPQEPADLIAPSRDSGVEIWQLPRNSSQGSFLGALTRDKNYVGVELQPLTSGLADYFGVHSRSGVLVGNVFPNSPASAAGLKAADVIQKVNGQPIVTLNDWEHAIRTNRGKQVTVTLIRDKKEQTVTMIAGHAKTSGELELPAMPDLQAMAQSQGDLAGIDASKMAAEISHAINNLDIQALQAEADQAVRRIDTTEAQKALDLARKQMLDSQQAIEKQVQELTRQLQTPQMD
jgi:predicted metalloprotease with PDZ domain